jgi:uncharacterized RDD family membrane protein YckC
MTNGNLSESMKDSSVDLRDQLSIDTPELVALEFPVAGIGSRSIACIVDYAIQGAAIMLVLLGLALLAQSAPSAIAGPQMKGSRSAGVWATAIVLIVLFLFQWGYFSLFEAFWNGQTPGKRMLRLRVIQQGGQQIGFFHALSRNLLRIVDSLPGFYLVAIVFVFATKRSQRLGDLVAATMVVHERKVETPVWDGTAARSFTASLVEPAAAAQSTRSTGLAADVIARLDHGDLELIESFNARRLDLPYKAGSALAERLAGQMAGKMDASLPADMSPETFLELLANEMRMIGNRS